MTTITLKRRRTYLGIYRNGIGPIWKFQPRFADFNAICEVAAQFLKRKLSDLENVNIQAMLGANSIKEMTIGPGARMRYKLVR